MSRPLFGRGVERILKAQVPAWIRPGPPIVSTRLVIFAFLVALVVSPPSAGTRLANRPGSSPESKTAACDPARGPSLGSRFAPIGSISLYVRSFQVERVDIAGSNPVAATFARAYSSADTRTTSMGPGWTNNFEVRLATDGTRDVLLTLPSGAVERFKGAQDMDRSTGTSRGYRVLTRQPDGGWVVNDELKKWTFTPGGSLLRVDDGLRGWAEVRYDGAKLAGTIGPNGPGLRVEIGPGGRLVQVADAADPNSFVRYAYDAAGRLVSAAPSRGIVQRFAYYAESQRISTVSDDLGAVVLKIDYDDKGRVIRERDARGLLDGEALTLAYEDLPDGGRRTTVTYPLSLIQPRWHPVQIAVHDAQGRLRALALRPTSRMVLIGRYDYDDQNRRIVLANPCSSERNPGPSDGLVAVR